jgi:hypothetical protein
MSITVAGAWQLAEAYCRDAHREVHETAAARPSATADAAIFELMQEYRRAHRAPTHGWQLGLYLRKDETKGWELWRAEYRKPGRTRKEAVVFVVG